MVLIALVVVFWIGFGIGCSWMRWRDIHIVDRWADSLNKGNE